LNGGGPNLSLDNKPQKRRQAMSNPQEPQELVAQFLLRTLPSGLLDTYITLTQLNYPIPDKYSLTSQWGKFAKEKGDMNGTNSSSFIFIDDSLQAVDFPIQTPHSALEKFHARIFGPLGPGYEPIIPPNIEEQPSLASVYNGAFGTGCGRVALEAYSGAIRGGLSPYEALVIGHRAGERCTHTWVMPSIPLPRSSPFSAFTRWRWS
jgi:hypothetical protein